MCVRWVVGPAGFEPATSRLWVFYHNSRGPKPRIITMLDYGPMYLSLVILLELYVLVEGTA